MFPKIDNPVTVKDFRPVSILSVLSKVYEKVISTPEKNYIEKSAIYNPTPSGFRKGHSTATLLLKFRNDIRKALNRTEITISVLTIKLLTPSITKPFCKSSFHLTLEFPRKYPGSNSIPYICSRTTICIDSDSIQ